MSVELIVAIIGLVAAVLGVVAALLGKRKIVLHRREAGGQEAPKHPNHLKEPAGSYTYDNQLYCAHCGFWLHPGYKETCPHCGKYRNSYCDTILSRMKCGHGMPYGIGFCTLCGKKAQPADHPPQQTGQATDG